VKKKYQASFKDKEDWLDFTKKINNISIKEDDLPSQKLNSLKVKKLDLHGYSLSEANKLVKKFIIESYKNNYKKVLIVTGKGSRSKSYEDPYRSEKLSILRYSVPEYIENDRKLNDIIISVKQADSKEGGEGAINIFLKNNKETTK
jgi:DNA-nicking Smr family endonuclease|tara:strand:- start:394 stop:831 length:438 start_codon:yes stop_codon:yes gene_type:complete